MTRTQTDSEGFWAGLDEIGEQDPTLSLPPAIVDGDEDEDAEYEALVAATVAVIRETR